MKRCVFLGSKALGLAIFAELAGLSGIEWLIIHPNDRADDRSILDEFKRFADDLGIQFVTVKSASHAKSVLLSFGPEAVLVCGWYWLLDAESVQSVPCFGIHNSLLPKYRGNAPLVWSILRGEPEVGTSLFRIAPGMDDGDIALQIKVPNRENDDIGTLLSTLETELKRRLPEKWLEIMEGRAALTPQNHSRATYCGLRTADDGQIDWTQPAGRVHDFIRAQAKPYPGAFSYLDNNKVVIWKTERVTETWYGSPGRVVARKTDGIIVACGEGALKILSIGIGNTKQDAVNVILSHRSKFTSGRVST